MYHHNVYMNNCAVAVVNYLTKINLRTPIIFEWAITGALREKYNPEIFHNNLARTSFLEESELYYYNDNHQNTNIPKYECYPVLPEFGIILWPYQQLNSLGKGTQSVISPEKITHFEFVDSEGTFERVKIKGKNTNLYKAITSCYNRDMAKELITRYNINQKFLYKLEFNIK